MTKVLIAVFLLICGYAALSQTRTGRHMIQRVGITAPSFSPTSAQSIGASAVNLAGKVGG